MEATHGVSARLALYNSGDHHARYVSFDRIDFRKHGNFYRFYSYCYSIKYLLQIFSKQGTYLAACMHFLGIYGQGTTVVGNSYRGGLDANTARKIQVIIL